MAKMTCKICENIYESSRSSCYCSKECKKKGLADNRKRYKERVFSSRTLVQYNNCNICDKLFVYAPKISKRNSYCSVDCKEKAVNTQNLKSKRNRKEKSKKYNAEYYQKNKERVSLRIKRYDIKNPEKRKARVKEWREEKRYKCRRDCANRRARKINATLEMDLNDHFEMIYKKAKEYEDMSGLTFNVDHIIPITNDDVCGLHVPWNLQILTFTDNMIKSNKFDGTYDNRSWIEDKNIREKLIKEVKEE